MGRAEAGCLYYGWTIKEDGSKLFCRETYVDGAAAGHHLSCVAKSGALGEALEKGYIALDNIDLMGTESDIADAKKCVDLTRNEKGCMYYGWTIQGDKLFCREAYVDAAAVQAHLDNIVPSVGEMLDSGAASLDKI